MPLVSVSAVIYTLGAFPQDTVKVCGYCLSANLGYLLGNWIDPDLDEIAYTDQEARMTHQIPILGDFLVAWFSIYAAYVARLAKLLHMSRPLSGVHRSKLTHSIFPGTFTRIVWLNLFFFLLISGLESVFKFTFPYRVDWLIPYFVGQYIGLGFADLIHIILDGSPKYANFSERINAGDPRAIALRARYSRDRKPDRARNNPPSRSQGNLQRNPSRTKEEEAKFLSG